MSSVETQQKLTPYRLRCPPPVTPEARWDGLILYPTQDQQAASTRHSTTGTSWFLGKKQKIRNTEVFALQPFYVKFMDVHCSYCSLYMPWEMIRFEIRSFFVYFPHLHAICKLPTCNVFCWTSSQQKLLNLPTCKCATVSQPLLPGVNLAQQKFRQNSRFRFT